MPAKRGPKPGNINAMKTGTTLVKRRRLVVGELPKQLLSVRREGRAYRRTLEAEVLRVHQQISSTHMHMIDTAAAATIASGIARWCLRHKLAAMTTSDVLACSKSILQSKQARDAAVRLLDLDRPPPNPWDQIDVPSKGEDDE